MGELLKGKVCVITGGAGSVGQASARRFLAEGAKVMLVDLNPADLSEAAEALASAEVATVAADVSQAESAKNYVSATVDRWGKFDVLFSNAGNQGPIQPTFDYPENAFDQVLAVHVRGAFLACKYGIPQMNDGGSVIITSSVVGTVGAPGSLAYVTAKHAQVGLMRTVALEAAARNIRVNTLHPGPIDNGFQLRVERGISQLSGMDGTSMINEMVALKRHAKPDEIARSALYLACELSSYVTGTTLIVDGGMTAG